MDLHYSQTAQRRTLSLLVFHYLMDLHYSQTCLPHCTRFHRFTTLWIYTILKQGILAYQTVESFTTLWIYTILKHSAVFGQSAFCFTTLWIYTILKRGSLLQGTPSCFTTLWIYTILKQTWKKYCQVKVSLPYGFTLFSNSSKRGSRRWLQFHYLMDLHYSQTAEALEMFGCEFHYLMDLHYSQTLNTRCPLLWCFTTLWIYTILKRCSGLWSYHTRFTTLWIYTILKQFFFSDFTKKVSLPYGFTLFSNLK